MVDIILGCVFITAGSVVIVYITIGRIFGFHRPIGYIGGGQTSFTGELAMGILFLCFGLTATHSPVWIIPSIAAFAVGFISQMCAKRQYRAKEETLRHENAAKYPGVFDNPPPNDIESINEDELDLFDAGSCAYLGRVSKDDVKALIHQFKDIPEQGPNDIFMLVESLEIIPKDSVSREFIMLLKKAFEKRDFLEIRWLSPSNMTKDF
jgi:hypothetical protein